MGISPATRELSCPIAEKSVRAVLRRGGLLGGPATMHVRCSEHACQYVDTNEPPCPLRLELFEVPSDRMVAERVTAQVEPTCLECVAGALHLTHDEIRRGLWPLVDRGLVRVRPGRCRSCGRRRVVAHSTRPRTAHTVRGRAPAPAVDLAADRQAAIQRLLSSLAAASGAACCPACLALAAHASLDEVRSVLGATGPLRQLVVAGGECGSCGRQQPLLAALPSGRRVG